VSANPLTRSASFRLAAGDRVFEGHFEGAPILPGVAHLALALSAVAHGCWSGVGELTGLRDVRFTRALRPSDMVEVELTQGPLPGSVRFELRSGGATASRGLLLFAKPVSRG